MPWTELYTLAGLIKGLYRAYKAFRKFMAERRWANRILHTFEEACPVGLLPTGFRAGTVVLLASGRQVLIEQVRPGDVIMATDPTTRPK